MKPSLRIFATLLLVVSLGFTSFAKKPFYSDKEKARIEKEIRKEAKKTAKKKSKDGWEIEQSGLMENVIARHMTKMALENLEERSSSATKKTRSMCRKQIQIDVANSYAKEQSQVVKGVITNKDRNMLGEESEDFLAEYESRIAMEIAGILQESYSIYRKNPDGTYDMEIFYLIDPEAAHSAKLRAAQRAVEIQELDEKWRKSISDAINDSDE